MTDTAQVRAAKSERYMMVRNYMSENYPAAFPGRGKMPVPLEIGIGGQIRDVLKAAGFSAEVVKSFCSAWFNRPEYKACLALEGSRVNLSGEVVGVVTSEDAAWAREACKNIATVRSFAAKKLGLKIDQGLDPVFACSSGSPLLDVEIAKKVRRISRQNSKKTRKAQNLLQGELQN